MIFYNKKLNFLLLSFSLSFFTCIERTNPWDPNNACLEVVKAEYRKDQQVLLNPLFERVFRRSQVLYTAIDTLSSNKEIYNRILIKNDSIMGKLKKIDSVNSSITANNLLVPCTDLQTMEYYTKVDTLSLSVFSDFEKTYSEFRNDSSTVNLIIEDGDKKCSHGIYSAYQRDSILQPIYKLSQMYDSLNILFKKEFALLDTNKIFVRYNILADSNNQHIKTYNDSISTLKWYCQKDPVVTSDSAYNKLKNLQPGDELYLGPGRFVIKQISISTGTELDYIVIEGSPFMTTVLDSVNFVLSNCINVRFRNLTFQNANECGIKLEDKSKNIIFENCVFRDNGTFGVEAIESSLDLNNCIITQNRGGGIKVDQGKNNVDVILRGTNLLITKNKGHGIWTIGAALSISNSTISDNTNDGVHLTDPNKQSSFYNSNFSTNGKSGIFRENTEFGIVRIQNNNFYKNIDRDIIVSLDILEAEDTRFDDPLFDSDYIISPLSPLYGLGIGYQYNR